MKSFTVKQIVVGLLASAGMLALYFGLISLLSGWNYALFQWRNYWPFVTVLALGFGLQMFLFQYLRDRRCEVTSGAVAASGVSGTVAMVACCAHHLVDFVPFLGLAGLATLVSASQIQVFWIGIAFNLAGVVYLGREVLKLR